MRKFIGFFERRRATDGRTDRQTLKYSCECVAEWRQVLGCRQVDRSCLPAAVSILTTPKHSRYMDPESCTRTNMNKSVFSYLRTLKTWHYLRGLLLSAVLRPCSNRSISPTRRAHSSKPVARCCSWRMEQTNGLIDGRTDIRTDAVPFHRPCSACYAGPGQCQ